MIRLTPVRWFALAAMALAASLGYSLGARRRALPAILGYAPKESRIVVATGEIEALWRGISYHFFTHQGVVSDSSPLEEWVADVRAYLQERDIGIRNAEDLASYGIDARRRLLLAVHVAPRPIRPDGTEGVAPEAVAAIPVTDYETFVRSLGQTLDEIPSSDTAFTIGGARAPVTAVGDGVYVIQPERGMAVLGTSVTILARSVADRHANLAFYQADDLLYAAARRSRHARRLGGPSAFLHARPAPVRGLGSTSATLTLSPPGVGLTIDVEIVPGFLSTLDALLTDAPRDASPVPSLPQTIGGVLAVADGTLYRSLPIDRWLVEALGRWPGPVTSITDEVRSARGVGPLAATLAGSDNGVPETILLARGGPDSLASLVSRLRERLTRERDRTVLARARDRYPGERPTVDALVDAGLLTDGGARWRPYQLDRGEILVDSTVPPTVAFPSSLYERQDGDLRVHLLSPPVTADDVRYNDAFSEVDSTLLFSDQYRVAAVQIDSALWIAPDADVLVAFLRSLPPSTPALTERAVYRDARRGGPAHPKVELFLDIDRLIALGLLDTDADVQATARRALAQLRHHQALAVTLGRTDARHIRIAAWLVRSGEGSPP